LTKKFVFVSGDIGGATYQLPVRQDLVARGHAVDMLADPEGNGADVLKKAGIFFRTDVNSELTKELLDSADLVFINTCASASKLEERVLLDTVGNALVVMGSDGLFNHGFSKWRVVPYDNRLYWFAINEGHAQAIRRLRPKLDPRGIVIVGQPAFDSVLDYIPQKKEIRLKARETLCRLPEEDIVILWWSQGMLDVISEDVCMLFHGLSYLSELESLEKAGNIRLVPRIHPKLNQTVSAGYVEELRKMLEICVPDTIIVQDNDDMRNMRAEDLCLASDVILSVTCTEDIKNVMMGGPPVVHLCGPLAQRWFEKELGQTRPYLPDIRTGQSLVAWSADQVGPEIEKALDPAIQKQLLVNWQAPTEKATKVVADKLIAIAEGRL